MRSPWPLGCSFCYTRRMWTDVLDLNDFYASTLGQMTVRLLRARLREVLAGYVDVPDLVPPALGPHSGVVGALELSRGRGGR